MRALKSSHWVLLVLVLPTMVAELMFPFVPGSTSLKVSILALLLAMISAQRAAFSATWALQVAMLAWFVFAALLRPRFFVSPFFRADLENGLQALSLAPLLAAVFSSPEGRGRFFLSVARVLVPLGAIASVMGWVKLYFLTQGVEFAALEWQGLYPRGTSLRIDYNVFALGIAFSLAAALWLRYSPDVSRFERAFSSIAVPLMMFTVAFTSSRRGAIFLLVLVALAPLLVPAEPTVRSRIVALRVPLASLAVAAGVLVLMLLGATAGPVGGVLEFVDLARAAERLLAVDGAGRLVETRAPLIQYAWDEVSRNGSVSGLILGRGDQYLFEMGRVFSRDFEYEYPHNFFLSAVLHGGIFFSGAVAALLLISARRMWAIRASHSWVCVVSALGLLFGVSSASSMYNIDVLFFLSVLGLALPQPGIVSAEFAATGP